MTDTQILEVAANNNILVTNVESVYSVTGGKVDGLLVQARYNFRSSDEPSKVLMIVGDKCTLYGKFDAAEKAKENMMNPTTLATFPAFAVTKVR